MFNISQQIYSHHVSAPHLTAVPISQSCFSLLLTFFFLSQEPEATLYSKGPVIQSAPLGSSPQPYVISNVGPFCYTVEEYFRGFPLGNFFHSRPLSIHFVRPGSHSKCMHCISPCVSVCVCS